MFVAASTVVEHLPCHPKVKGLSPDVANGTRREKMAKKIIQNANGYSTKVEHSPCHTKVKGLSLDATDEPVREKMGKKQNADMFKL